MNFNPFKHSISQLNEFKPRKGRALISEPFMLDQYFKRSVVYLTEHGEDGTVGFMLNKTLDVKLNDIIIDFPKIDAPVYLGGPVQPQNLFYLHRKGDLITDSIEVADGVFWNGNFEQLKTAIEQKLIASEDIRFFLGYSGWDAEQLKEEINQNSWLVQNISPELIFDLNKEDLWKAVIRHSNPEIAPMADFPEDPSLN